MTSEQKLAALIQEVETARELLKLGNQNRADFVLLCAVEAAKK